MSKLSPSEKRGLLMIGSVLLVGFIIQWVQPYFVFDDLYDYSVQDSIFKKISSDTLNVEVEENLEKAVPQLKKSKRKTTKSDLLTTQININTASQKELEKLPRIGPATAKNIINFRTANGPFKKVEDITKVKRIGPKTLEKLRPFITLGDSL